MRFKQITVKVIAGGVGPEIEDRRMDYDGFWTIFLGVRAPCYARYLDGVQPNSFLKAAEKCP